MSPGDLIRNQGSGSGGCSGGSLATQNTLATVVKMSQLIDHGHGTKSDDFEHRKERQAKRRSEDERVPRYRVALGDFRGDDSDISNGGPMMERAQLNVRIPQALAERLGRHCVNSGLRKMDVVASYLEKGLPETVGCQHRRVVDDLLEGDYAELQIEWCIDCGAVREVGGGRHAQWRMPGGTEK